MSEETTYSAIRTILGKSVRRERWHLTDEVDVLTALGRSVFDLRGVETTGRPVVEIAATCLLGSIRLIVPPGTMVVLDGTSFLASASSIVRPGDESALPRIELTATTILGRVKIVSLDDDASPVTAIIAGDPVGSAESDLSEEADEADETAGTDEAAESDRADAADPSDALAS